MKDNNTDRNESGSTILKAPSASVTMQEIADRCNLAHSTVSLALRHDPRVRPATAERVFRVAEELGYDPSLHENARRLALKRYGKDSAPNHIIAIFCPRDFLQMPFYLRIFSAFSEALMPEGYGVLTGYINEDPNKRTPVPFYPMFCRGFVDGLFFMSPHNIEFYSEKLRATPGFATRPLLAFRREDLTSPVVIDDEKGGYLAAKHLLDLGHRHLLHFFYSNEEDYFSPNERVKGVKRAFREHSLDPETNLHLLPYWRPWHTPKLAPHNLTTPAALSRKTTQVKRSLLAYLRKHPEITGIMALNDSYAMNIWYTLHEAKFRVPEDYSIVGYDDTDGMYNENGTNLLTTVHYPIEQIGENAARIILKQINSNSAESEQMIIDTSGIIIRHSTTVPNPTRQKR